MNRAIFLAFFLLAISGAYAVDHDKFTPAIMDYDPSTGESTPFFPIGWYATYDDVDDCVEFVKNLGGNTVLVPDLQWHRKALSDEVLAKAQAAGVKVVIGTHRSTLASATPSLAYSYSDVLAFAYEYKDHPALLGFMFGDENLAMEDYNLTAEQVVGAVNALRTVDLDNSACQMVCSYDDLDRLSEFMEGYNVLYHDVYKELVATPEFGGFDYRLTEQAVASGWASANNTSYLFVGQGMGDRDSRRWPTVAEYRSTVLGSLASGGARGILSYLYSKGSISLTPAAQAFYANAVAPVFAELGRIQHAMETGYNIGTVELDWDSKISDASSWDENYNRISSLMLHDDLQAKCYLILSNNYSSAQNITATVSNLPDNLDSLVVANETTGDSYTLTESGNGTYELDVSLEAYEANIYTFYFLDLRECGDPGTNYLKYDLNHDCYVNVEDFALFANEWMNCTDPANITCD